MNTYELIKNSLKVPVKELASELNISPESVYKWISGEQRNPIDRLEVILNNSDKDRILNYLCNKFGGYYMKDVDVNCASATICADACKEFGELLSAMSSSLEDGKVTKEEFLTIKKEYSDVMNVIQGFLNIQAKKLELELML